MSWSRAVTSPCRTCREFPGFKTFNGPHPAQPRLPRRGRVQGQGHPDHRPQLLGRGCRLAMLQVWREVDHQLLSLEADGLQVAGEMGGEAAAAAGREQDRLFQGRDHQGSRCDHPVPRLSAHFPFLPDSLRLKTANRMWPLELYRGVVWEANPKAALHRHAGSVLYLNMFDAQAWYSRRRDPGTAAVAFARRDAEARRRVARARGNARRWPRPASGSRAIT